MNSQTILAVDKNTVLVEQLKESLEEKGKELIQVTSMFDALNLLSSNHIDLIGINADNIDFITVLPIMRQATIMPIYINTSNYKIDEEISSREAGADYYSLWLSDTQDNVKRIIIMLDNYIKRYSMATMTKSLKKSFSYGNVFILPRNRQVFIGEQEIDLTKKEYELLYILISEPRRVFTYEQIIRRIWGEEYTDNHVLLLNVIKRLRKKIQLVEATRYIQNIQNVGYAFDRV